MTLDPYRICPCGSGKKVKFCCSKDILSELDKVIRAIEGEQRVAALDQIVKLIDTKGPRPALLSLKANLQLSLSAMDEAESTIAELSKLSPHNSSTIAMRALLDAGRGNVEAAVDSLQQAMEYAEGEITSAIYSAIGAVANGLIQAGSILGGRGHCMLQIALSGGDDQGPLSLLLQLDRLEDLSPLFKEDFTLETPPSDVPWVGEFKAALGSARRGTWRAACESLISLSQKVPRQPAIVRNIAILRGWLGEEQEACRAWRDYAALDGVPFADAVEAEALAQDLDDEQHDVVPQIKLTYPVLDTDRLMERLLSDRRWVRIPLDERRLADADQPPPRGAFLLLDRPAPENGNDLRREDVPLILGFVSVFGKETDRNARMEVMLDRAADIADRRKLAAEAAGEWVGEPGSEEQLGETPLGNWMFSPRWYVSESTPSDKTQQLAREFQRDALLQRWPATPLAVLGGKCPRDAAPDPAYRVSILASILLLELSLDRQFEPSDFNELRGQLGLPPVERIDPTDVDVLALPTSRLMRLDVSKLNDEQLVAASQRAIMKGLRRAIYELTSEMLSRPSLRTRINRESLHEVAMKTAPDSTAALHWAGEARRLAEADHKSPAQWLIAELSIRIARGEAAEANELLKTLHSRHLKEPGIAQALGRVLANYGLLRADGSPNEPHAPTAAPAAPETKKIWTPDSASAPASSSPGKSKLWVPGMD